MTAPVTLDLTLAAYAVVDQTMAGPKGAEYDGALAVWTALTGMSEAPALAYAHDLANAGTRQRAALIPF